MMVFVSLSVIMLIPKVAEIIKSAVSGRPFGYGAAIGEAMAIPIIAGKGIAGGGVSWTAEELRTGKGRLGGWVSTHPRIARVVRGGVGSKVLETVEERARKGFF